MDGIFIWAVVMEVVSLCEMLIEGVTEMNQSIGGMLLGYKLEKDMARAFRYGIAAGAASVMTEGNQPIDRSDFDALLDQVRIQEV